MKVFRSFQQQKLIEFQLTIMTRGGARQMARLPVKDPEEEPEIDQSMSEPIVLQRPSQVRTVFPEA